MSGYSDSRGGLHQLVCSFLGARAALLPLLGFSHSWIRPRYIRSRPHLADLETLERGTQCIYSSDSHVIARLTLHLPEPRPRSGTPTITTSGDQRSGYNPPAESSDLFMQCEYTSPRGSTMNLYGEACWPESERPSLAFIIGRLTCRTLQLEVHLHVSPSARLRSYM